MIQPNSRSPLIIMRNVSGDQLTNRVQQRRIFYRRPHEVSRGKADKEFSFAIRRPFSNTWRIFLVQYRVHNLSSWGGGPSATTIDQQKSQVRKRGESTSSRGYTKTGPTRFLIGIVWAFISLCYHELHLYSIV